MIVEMSKTRRILFIGTVFLCNFILMGDMIFNNTINDVYNMYPDVPAVVNFIISGRSLVTVFASLIAGRLIRIFHERPVILAGTALALAGGVCLLLVPNPYFMAVMRVVSGFGGTFCSVGCLSIINDTNTELESRSRMMGYFNGAQVVCGIILSIVSGNLAAVSPSKAYSMYWMYAPLFLLVILFLPNIKANRMEEAGPEAATEKRGKWAGFGSIYWALLIAMCLGNLGNNYLMLYTQTYVVENRLGTAVQAGYMNALMIIGGLPGAVFFGWIYRKLGKRFMPYAYLGYLGIYAVFWLSRNPVLIYAATPFRGLLFIVTFSYCMTVLPSLVPEEKRSMAIATATALSAGFMFLTTYSVSLTKAVLETDLFTPTLITPIIIFGVAALLQFWVNGKIGKKTVTKPAQANPQKGNRQESRDSL